MAQYWVVCDTLDKVGSWSQGNNTLAVATDSGMSVIRVSHGTGNPGYVDVWPIDLVASPVAEVRVYTKVEINTTPRGCGSMVAHPSAVGAVRWTSSGSDGSRIYVGATLIGGATTVSGLVNDGYHWRGSILRRSGEDRVLDQFAWMGGEDGAGLMPGTPVKSDTNLAGMAEGATLHGWGCRSSSTEGHRYYVRIIAVGTDGDPAPTGPVQDSSIWLPNLFTSGVLAAMSVAPSGIPTLSGASFAGRVPSVTVTY